MYVGPHWKTLPHGGWALVSGPEPAPPGTDLPPWVIAAVVPAVDGEGFVGVRPDPSSVRGPRVLRGMFPTPDAARLALEQALFDLDALYRFTGDYDARSRAQLASDAQWEPGSRWLMVGEGDNEHYERVTGCGRTVRVVKGAGLHAGLWCAERHGRFLAGINNGDRYKVVLWFADAEQARNSVDAEDAHSHGWGSIFGYEWI